MGTVELRSEYHSYYFKGSSPKGGLGYGGGSKPTDINVYSGKYRNLGEKTWIKLGISLVYFILGFKIIDMENFSHEWLKDFMYII